MEEERCSKMQETELVDVLSMTIYLQTKTGSVMYTQWEAVLVSLGSTEPWHRGHSPLIHLKIPNTGNIPSEAAWPLEPGYLGPNTTST